MVVVGPSFFFLSPDQPPLESSASLLLGVYLAPDCKLVICAETAVCVAPWGMCKTPPTLQVTEQRQVPDSNQANQRPSLGVFTNQN